jgi:glyoxylase-like metal-dependent hydrolase (beta-lactamase superfamily II)
MYELIQVLGNSYYIQSPAKIGLVKINEHDVVLIDSGSDKDAGRKVRQILDENGWNLTAIFNTHSNADHIGGNKYLQSQTGCKIYAPEIECDFTRHPLLEPSFLYGANPPADLRHKFLLAEKSDCEYLTDKVLPSTIKAISLPGHFFDMVGFETSDGVVYLADCLSSEKTLEKYGIGFIYDVKEYLNTLENVKKMNAKMFVPSHADPTDDIKPLVDVNINKVLEIAQHIEDICTTFMCFEHILQKLFEIYNLKMTFEQYVLVGSTVKSYLTYLKEQGRITAEFENNMLLWKKA